ncbi:MAG TPA: methyl-accepting chemotaxis protein [Spirochaetota bacterium]|nr:methyl-accepting chemotaxis protein [Spirochaetota bacterium]
MQQFKKLKRYSILLIIIFSIIIIVQVILSIFIGLRSIDNFNKSRRSELVNIWNKFIKVKFDILSNFVNGYSEWTDIARKIKNNRLLEEDIITWKAGNADKNDICAIIVKDKILIKDGVEIENLDFIFQENFIKEIYKNTNMNKASQDNEYIIIRGNFIILLKASPICDDSGLPYTEGIEIFGILLKEDDIKDAEDFLNSYIKIENKEVKSFLNIKITDYFDNNNFKIVRIEPKINLFRLIFSPLIFTLILQIVITSGIIFTFLFLIFTISKLYNNLAIQTNNFINLFKDVDYFIKDIKNIEEFLNNFNELLIYFESSLNMIKENIVKIENRSKIEIENIEGVNNKINEIINNINTIIIHINHNYNNNIKNDESMIEDLNKNTDKIKELSYKTREISDKLNDYAYEVNQLLSSSIKSITEVEKSSNTIREISDVISNIAEKTNLLSINASIESAHSGQYGKGFAIVAHEIRKLSTDTSKKAKDIIEAIKTISGKISSAVAISKDGSKKLEETLDLSFDNKEAIDSLNEYIGIQLKNIEDVVMSTKLIFSILEEISVELDKQKEFSKELTEKVNMLENFSEENRKTSFEYINLTTELISKIPELRKTSEESVLLVTRISDFLNKFNKYKDMKL